MSLREYLKILKNQFDPSIDWIFRTWNFQAFELGLDYSNPSAAYLATKLTELDKAFHLVLIKEYFYESLVLLANELCVDYRLMFITFRTQAGSDYVAGQGELSKAEMDTFEKYFHQDIQIYHFFNQTFWKKVETFGRQKMADEVEKVKSLYKKCSVDRSLCIVPSANLKSSQLLPEVGVPFRPGQVPELLSVMKEAKGACKFGAYRQFELDLPSGCTLLDYMTYTKPNETTGG